MTRRTIHAAIAAPLLGALMACAAHYNFTTAETVLDAPGVEDASSYALDGDLGDASADSEIRAALDRELGARGWLAAGADADVVVGYALTREQGSSHVTDGFLAPFGTVNPQATRDLPYLNQTLVIDFVSGDTGEDIWRGWASARFYAPPGEERAEMINQAVASILAQLDD